jgi:hypothetical protein
MSCVGKHKFESGRIELSEKKMTAVLTDILLMESYVFEKMPGVQMDSVTIVKKSFYKPILAKHKVDSSDFYSTLYYYQSHPKEFTLLLNLVDSSLSKIKPKDTSIVEQLITVPQNIDALSSFHEQEKAMREEFLKKNKQTNKE